MLGGILLAKCCLRHLLLNAVSAKRHSRRRVATLYTCRHIQRRKYVKPLRQCQFCKVCQSRLSRHISTVHKSETQVKEILKTSTTSTQLTEQLGVLRKEGIFNENVFQATQPEPYIHLFIINPEGSMIHQYYKISLKTQFSSELQDIT